MKKIVLTAGLLLASLGMAQADPIAERQALMKDMGRAVGSVAKMAQGQQEFDAATVKAAFATMAADAQKLDADTLFPEGTETGGGTEASPRIWEDRAGFEEQIAKYQEATAVAVAAEPQDLASFQTTFRSVTANCATCHQGYRVKK
jgi:cytochrome c556